jgi:hypothetical protein
VRVISELVEAYVSNPWTIVLSVVSAVNDAANQVTLKRAREHDSNGQRTLGIITKPDVLSPGSENEDAFLALAMNQEIVCEKGWRVLRGRGNSERDTTFTQRNATEAEFFSKGRWLELDPDSLGIDALRLRLSELLLFTSSKSYSDFAPSWKLPAHRILYFFRSSERSGHHCLNNDSF